MQPPPSSSQTTAADIASLIVEGYRFYRSDGQPFDGSIGTFVPHRPLNNDCSPYAAVVEGRRYSFTTAYNDKEKVDDTSRCWDSVDVFHHVCATPAIAATEKPFLLANRCQPSWNGLSAQQQDVIVKIEKEVNDYRRKGVYFCAAILEGVGGCGKTRLMAYVINHAPDSTHVLYLTKQNKRLQDFLCGGELDSGELVPPRPVTDMSKFVANDFRALRSNAGGRYACSVEKLVYNTAGGYRCAKYANTRNVVQWQLEIPDRLFAGDAVERNKSDVVVFVDEYTMIAPPLLHKLLHCIEETFSAPTVLVLGGDRFQLGPIGWNEETDHRYADAHGENAPPDAVTQNNRYYSSDVRKELANRLGGGHRPCECIMTGSQRSRDDPDLAKMVTYLRGACEKRHSLKAIERRLVAFGRRKAIAVYRRQETARYAGCKIGLIVYDNSTRIDKRRCDVRVEDDEKEEEEDYDNDDKEDFEDVTDEDRHLGDDDSRDEMETESDAKARGGVEQDEHVTIDWNTPPTVDMTPFIQFYTGLYKKLYELYCDPLSIPVHGGSDGCGGGVGSSGGSGSVSMSAYVYEKAYRFVHDSFPVFMVKKNDKCNLLSDTFLKTLYNGVYKELVKESDSISGGVSNDNNYYSNTKDNDDDYNNGDDDDNVNRAKRARTAGGIKAFLSELCVSMSVSDNSPVQQTVMVGVPYRMTDTLKSKGSPVVSNGELVLLTGIEFEVGSGGGDYGGGCRRIVSHVNVRPLQRRTSEQTLIVVVPGATSNRLTGLSASVAKGLSMYMLPMVPMICENIYQLQGNTIVSDCFVDLTSTNSNDVYVAISRFRNARSIRGILLSR